MPIIQQQCFSNGVCLILWSPQESEQQLKPLLYGDRNRYDHFLSTISSSKRRIELLTARVALDTLLDRSTHVNYLLNSKKPYLIGGGYISVSHTQGCVAVAYHPHFCVGIDVEKISERILRLRSKFMSQIELQDTQNEDGLLKSLIIWSAKESTFKLLGQQEVNFAQHLKVQPFSLSQAGQLLLNESKTQEEMSLVVYYQVFSNWVMTIVLE